MALEGVTVEGNESEADGGGIFVRPGSTVSVKASTISENTSGPSGGGGGYVGSGGTLSIEGSHITANKTSGNGGGILAVAGSTVTIRGILPGACDDPLLLPADTYCGSVDGNSASTGGAIGGAGADFDIETISMRSNTATGLGETVSLSDGSLQMTNVLLSQSVGGSGSGELRLESAASAVLSGVTLISEQTGSNPSTFADFGPPVSATSNSALTITESIVATGAPMTGGGIATVPATCTLFTEIDPATTFTGPDRIHGPGADPIFVTDPNRGPWRLGTNSKALDLCSGVVSDLDGLGRPSAHDMGALERL